MGPTERRKLRKRRHRFIFALAGSIVFLSYMARAFFGDSGILVGLQVKSEFERQLQTNTQLAEQNRALADEIRLIQSNPRYLEARARSEFGFGRPGEVVFRFSDSEEAP